MKAKYIMAIAALGSTLTLAVVRPSSAAAINSAPTAPPGPASAVWDGSDYVGQGQTDGKYYFLAPNNTWMRLDADPARQQRFLEWQENNPNWQSQIQSTRSGGQYHPVGVKGPYPSWSNPSAQPSGIRNTRHQGHDMGQTRAIAPPLVKLF